LVQSLKTAGLFLLLGGGAEQLAGQAPGMPPQFAPGALPGVGAAVDFGPSNGVDGRVTLNLAYASLAATYGDRQGGPNAWSGMVTLHLVRDPVRPWSLSLHLVYGDGGIRSEDEWLDAREMMAGVAVGWNPEGVPAIQVPWIGLRLVRRSAAGPGDIDPGPWHTGFGVSAGTELRLSALLPQVARLGGPTLHLTGDILSMPRHSGSGHVTEARVSFGIGFLFAFRGFPERGIIPAPRQKVE
jgi:hypothetical protein